MSVESEILRIQHNIADTYAAVADKGGEVPLQPNSENLAAAVASIPAGSGGEIYSTEETRIGTWIDGKPLYQRVYLTKTALTNNQIGSILTYDEDMTVVNFDGVIGGGNKINIYNPDYFAFTRLDLNTHSIFMRTNWSPFLGADVRLILQYTKTTD